jgi:hypothetical protein
MRLHAVGVMVTMVFAPQVRLAAPRLDARLAAGEDPLSSPTLALRGAQLASQRLRYQLAGALERAWSRARDPDALSSAIPVDAEAVGIAWPALKQLAVALRSRERVGVRGVALTRVLLTEPGSALYGPRYPEELYERAREALFAL